MPRREDCHENSANRERRQQVGRRERREVETAKRRREPGGGLGEKPGRREDLPMNPRAGYLWMKGG